MRTTLNQIRAHNPCVYGWAKLLRGLGKTQPDDEVIWIDQIIDHSGLDDALRCLRAVDGCDREIRLYAVWCARRVQHLTDDPRSIAALDVAERFARGEASDAELAAAWEAAWEAAWAATAAQERAAARAATWAPAASREAAAACSAERTAQAEELRRVCCQMREAES